MQRRQFLSLAALTGFAAACGTSSGGGSAPHPKLTFGTPLHIPPLLQPALGTDGSRRFDLVMQAGQTQILPGKQTATWGFNGPLLGPTLRAKRGDTVRMTVRNQLPVTSTVHWHGDRKSVV